MQKLNACKIPDLKNAKSFTLPNSADSDKIEAKYQDDILRVIIPKKEEANPKPAKLIAIH